MQEGACEVWLQRPDKAEPEIVKEYSAGDSFGELALLYNAPRAATVKVGRDTNTYLFHDLHVGLKILTSCQQASSNCTLWAMDRMTFRTILLHTTSHKRQLYEKFLEDVPLLQVGYRLPIHISCIPPAIPRNNYEYKTKKIYRNLCFGVSVCVHACVHLCTITCTFMSVCVSVCVWVLLIVFLFV